MNQSPATLTGILEVKDRRIESLEQEVARLDAELGRAQEQPCGREARALAASPRLEGPGAADPQTKLLKDKVSALSRHVSWPENAERGCLAPRRAAVCRERRQSAVLPGVIFAGCDFCRVIFAATSVQKNGAV